MIDGAFLYHNRLSMIDDLSKKAKVKLEKDQKLRKNRNKSFVGE